MPYKDPEQKRARDKAYKEANREMLNKKQKLYAEANKEIIRVKQKLYYASKREVRKAYRNANKERIQKQKQIYRQKPETREREQAYNKEYRQRPEVKARQQEYNRKRKQAPGYLEKQRIYQNTPEYKKYQQEYNQTPEYKEKRRKFSRVFRVSFVGRCARYKITTVYARSVFAQQVGKCLFCPFEFPQFPSVDTDRCSPLINFDHDHSNNKFRGFLCRGCNAGLGQIEKFLNENKLEAAIKYINDHRKNS